MINAEKVIGMRKPVVPPDIYQILHHLISDSDRYLRLIEMGLGPEVNGHYYAWDELRRRQPPAGLNHEEWWAMLKQKRDGLRRDIPLKDAGGRRFGYVLTDKLLAELNWLDMKAGGRIGAEDRVLTEDMRDRYYFSSLAEEAITSSQLEGAHTTQRRAKAMLREKRAPRDRSERMIYNNFLTMERVADLASKPLTVDAILELHELTTRDTLEQAGESGRFRRADELVHVSDGEEVMYFPPPADELEQRMLAFCAFANGEDDTAYVHPMVRAMLVHFWLAVDHPFTDGNGRTARALFYWSALKHGYWLFRFVSISRVIYKTSGKYARAFLHSEADDNDSTYFLLYHLAVIRQAIEELHAYLDRKTREIAQVDYLLKANIPLNHRQRALLGHALRNPSQLYTIQSHRTSHGVVYQTARTDLQSLAEIGLLTPAKSGRTYHYHVPNDLNERLAKLAGGDI